MTLKEMFKKIAIHNEITEYMGTEPVVLYFSDIQGAWSHGEKFATYTQLRRHIEREYIPEIAEKLIKADWWKFNENIDFAWRDGTSTFSASLTNA